MPMTDWAADLLKQATGHEHLPYRSRRGHFFQHPSGLVLSSLPSVVYLCTDTQLEHTLQPGTKQMESQFKQQNALHNCLLSESWSESLASVRNFCRRLTGGSTQQDSTVTCNASVFIKKQLYRATQLKKCWVASDQCC